MTFYKNIIDSEILNKYFGPESFIYALITSATGISSKLNPPIEYREIENSENKKKAIQIISIFFISMSIINLTKQYYI